MAGISLPRDNNRVTVIGGTSSVDGVTPVTIYVDPTTHRVLVNVTGGGSGVTSVASADGSITVTNPTTTVDLAVVKAPKLTTARTIGTVTGDITSSGSSFDGTANNTNALTLATVNSNVGSFTSANITVNAKGLITAASNGIGGGGLTVGTTTIASGTTTRVLYDNAGVLGEYTISGSGNVAMTTSPVFTTPSLGAATATTLTMGTLNYSASNPTITAQASVNSYLQQVLQNTSTGATASADFVVNNSISTDTTNYGDFGMNSSGFTGTAVLNQPSYVYLTSTTVDLAIGTTTANAIHFVVNNGTADAMTISSAGGVSIPGLTSNGLVKTSGGTGALSVATAGTDYQAPISLTTTGSGAATFISNVLNIPTPSGGGITYTEVTGTTQALAINSGYILNNAGLVTATLPSTAAVGSVIYIVGKGAGGWRIAQNASGQIHFGNQNTTSGTGGRLDSVNLYDCVELVCIVANNEWVVNNSVGNITVT